MLWLLVSPRQFNQNESFGSALQYFFGHGTHFFYYFWRTLANNQNGSQDGSNSCPLLYYMLGANLGLLLYRDTSATFNLSFWLVPVAALVDNSKRRDPYNIETGGEFNPRKENLPVQLGIRPAQK